MIPPLRLDVSWSDLGFAARSLFTARDAASRVERLEHRWSARGDALCTASVRLALDLWLEAMAFQSGDEVLFSGFTIPDMPRIAQEHGLVPRFVDVDPEALVPTVADCERAFGPRTRALVVAHLFGARSNLDELAAWCARRGVALVEDAAQAYAADGWTGRDDAALSLFSFGTIKTATALGGALCRVRDPDVLRRMRERRDAMPQASRRKFAAKLTRAIALRALSTDAGYGLVATLARTLHRDHREWIRSSTRSFPGGLRMDALRHRPCAPLLALLERRLERASPADVRLRGEQAERMLADELLAGCELAGRAAPEHSHWVLAVLSERPEEVTDRLRAAGLDATRIASARALGDGPGLQRLERELVWVPVRRSRSRRTQVAG